MMQTLHVELPGEFRPACGNRSATRIGSARLRSPLVYLIPHRDAPRSQRYLLFSFPLIIANQHRAPTCTILIACSTMTYPTRFPVLSGTRNYAMVRGYSLCVGCL